MTREEYEKLIDDEDRRHHIEKENYEKNIIAIKRKFALANNKYKIGDKIADRSDFIEITKIKIAIYSDPPSCVYEGFKLKKDSSRMKSGKMSFIYQSNILNAFCAQPPERRDYLLYGKTYERTTDNDND